jgi:hypothetical protein
VYNHPFARGCILDVFAAVVHSLADFHENIVTIATDGSASVNLHFDIDTPAITVSCKRDQSATLQVTPKAPCDVRIRVPAWASRESVGLSADGKTLPLRWEGSFVVIPKAEVTAGMALTLVHALPERKTTEVMPVSQRKFELTWRGDEVVACDPGVEIYPART